MLLLCLKRNSKIRLLSSLFVLLVNLIVFVFKCTLAKISWLFSCFCLHSERQKMENKNIDVWYAREQFVEHSFRHVIKDRPSCPVLATPCTAIWEKKSLCVLDVLNILCAEFILKFQIKNNEMEAGYDWCDLHK